MNFLKMIPIILLLFFGNECFAQENSIRIQEAQANAIENYPLIKQKGLIEKSKQFSLSNAAKGYYPQVAIYGQATYQSDVTQLPITLPGKEIPTLDKDQYKLYGEVSLNLYDGRIIKQKKETIRANASEEQHQLEVQLYDLKKRINQLFFGILLLETKLQLNQLLQKDIQVGMDNIQAAITNGTALQSEADRLQAELLKTQQKATSLEATKKGYTTMLELFIGKEITGNTVFVRPKPIALSKQINRPKMDWFQSRTRALAQNNKMLRAKNIPKIDLFVQGGYGRPGLNMLSNEFDAYYIGGVRLKIPLSGFYTLKKERALIEVEQSKVAVQKETFLFNTNLQLKKQKTELEKFQELLSRDNRIIALRENVKSTAAAQLKYGLVGTNDYLREAIAESQARQNKSLHEIQMLLILYKMQWITGQYQNTNQK